MTPKRMLTIAGVWYLLEGATAFFTGIGFDFMSYGFGILCLSLGILFLAARDELASKLRIVVFAIGFLATLGVSLIAYYAQWSGRFMDSALGYVFPTIWLIVAVGFFIAGRDNTAMRIRRLN